MHSQKNDAVRFENFDSLNEYNQVCLTTFFRKIELPHVFEEIIAPSLKTGNAMVCVAIIDRPWPPWGIGSQQVVALSHVHPVGETDAGLSHIFVLDESLTNIGLQSALFKETLQRLIGAGKTEISYLVIENSVYANRVLFALGFRRTDSLFLTEYARYYVYRADVNEVLQRLGLDKILTSDLLAHNIEDSIFDRNALFQSMLQLATKPYWFESSIVAEIIANLGIGISALPPGGIGGTPGPGIELPRDIFPGSISGG